MMNLHTASVQLCHCRTSAPGGSNRVLAAILPRMLNGLVVYGFFIHLGWKMCRTCSVEKDERET